MYLSPRMARTRNIGTAVVNGSITLIILLIAPIGLAAVITNTLLVAAATYGTGTMADRLMRYLQSPPERSSALRRRDDDDL
jgi:hypothetical protein